MGLLVYFGYPAAHEDDARGPCGQGWRLSRHSEQVQVSRVDAPRSRSASAFTPGLVVIGEIGSSEKREMLALGETPNIAARVQGLAEPDTVVISAATHRLVQGLFECQDLGPQTLKGISTPLSLYRVVRRECGAEPL